MNPSLNWLFFCVKIADEQEAAAAKRTKEEAVASHYGERGRSGYDQVPIKSLQPGDGVLALFYPVIFNFDWIIV